MSLAEFAPTQEEGMLLTLNNRIGGSSSISPLGYVVLSVALFGLAWVVGG